MRVLLTTLHSKYIHASLALPCLASYCHDCGCELDILEFTMHEPKESVLAHVISSNPDVVAFSVYLWNRQETLELVDALSVARPGLRIILGGPEISFDGPEIFERHPGLTALIHGEGELPLHGLLSAWQQNTDPDGVPRLSWRGRETIHQSLEGPPLEELDLIPSPFANSLADLSRGFTYFETSRGCPYRCSFCMSALDDKVRSYSMSRIQSDLKLLMDHGVPKIKLVDRTFNYDPKRARELFAFILEHNRTSHFHFEIGAHLLDDETLSLLEKVPEGMFQFEIGVQSTLEDTLKAIDRSVDLGRLEENVRALRERTRIHLHLDLIAGLPGETYSQLLDSIDHVIALRPHHLQIEPVKLLHGSPLRNAATETGLRYDPNPPYTVLTTPELTFDELSRIRNLSRLLDLTWNHGRMQPFLTALANKCGSFARGLDTLCVHFKEMGTFRHPLSQRGLFEAMVEALNVEFSGMGSEVLIEHLARDYALSERVSPHSPPDFLDTNISEEEQTQVRDQVATELDAIRGKGIKLQHFSCCFRHLSPNGRSLHLFLYLTSKGEGMTIKEFVL